MKIKKRILDLEKKIKIEDEYSDYLEDRKIEHARYEKEAARRLKIIREKGFLGE